jgi:tetratricopeptide (TPR) repeat protein
MGTRFAFLLVALSLCRPAAADSRSQMQRSFAKGNRLYKRGRYVEAKAAFAAAYDAYPAPGLLFNLGQCSRKLRESKNALTYFREYLRLKPGARNRAEVERTIADIEAATAPRPPPPGPPAPETPPVEPAPPAVAPVVEAPPAIQPIAQPVTITQAPAPATWPAWTLMGVGAASAALGLVFVVQARNAADEANDCILGREPPENCQPAIDRHESRTTLAAVTIGVGAAAIVGGGTWLYYLRRADETVALDVQPHRAVLAYGFAY